MKVGGLPHPYHGPHMPPTELLERHEQLDWLRAHLSDAAEGRGAMVFIGGEAGIGKSALVQRFCEEATASCRVLIGGCDAMQAPRPLGPLVDMAPSLGASFTALLEGSGAREHVFGHFLDALRERPTVAVFEDVHWADDATLDLLRYLGRRIGTTRALVIVTYRRDEAGPRHPLRNAMGDLATAAGVARLTLLPLTREAVARLAEGIDVDVDELHRVTAGNPFFVTEVVAAGGDRLPTSVRDAVGARLSRLSEDARGAVEAVSVVGRAASPSLLAGLGASTEAVDASLAGGLLQEADGLLAFRHELAREAVLGSLSVVRRRKLHGAVLSALEASPELRADQATLAHHAAEAGDADAVLRLAPAAGYQAAALGAHREAWSQFARALPYLERLPDEQHTELLEAYARECEILDRQIDGKAAWTTAIERWRAAGRTERWADGLTELARVLFTLGENAAAEAASAQAIDVLEGLPAGAALARAYRQQAALRMLDRDTDAAIAWGKRAIELATTVGDASVLAGAHGAVAASILLEGRRDYVEHYERAVELGREHGLHVLHANAHVNRGSGAGELHRFDEAERFLRLALQVAEQHDLAAQASYALAWLGLTQVYQGRWDEAAKSIERVLGRPSSSAIARIMALVSLGRLRVRRGDPEVWPPLDEALVLALRTDALQRLAPVRAARAEAAWYEGDRGRVGGEAAAAFEAAVRARHPWFVGELGYWRSLAGGLDELPPWAAEPFALQVRGRPGAAAAAWSALGCPFESARALAESTVDRDVRGAIAAFDQLGARVAGQRARARLQELGAVRIPRGPRERTRRHPAGLTPREAQVLARLADGLSNAQIAARHGVSPRTVEHQVSSVLAKLGVDTRAAAIAAAHRRGLLRPT
jgi:DNA-binding CsgD family transcriptional regulator/tetratricopeptide (TPR) repeat protein